jgi:hypothetical protein
MKSAIPTLAIATYFFITAGCGNSAKEFKDKKLVIASKQTVKIKELDLSITNNGCGREWVAGAERPFCGLIIKRKDSTIHAGGDFKPVYIGNIEITMDRMNPWGREEDSVPPGGCRVWVKKLEGR